MSAGRNTKHRTRTLAALTALAALALAACSSAAQGTTTTAHGEDAAGVTVLKIADPGNAGVLAYAKKTGAFDKPLAAAHAKIEWGGSYASFTATIDALNAGSINILEGAISPAVGFLSTSDNLKIFSVIDPQTGTSVLPQDGLVVPAKSTAESLKDLVGKKIAVNKAGKGEYLLLLALQQAGLSADSVQRVYLNPQEAGAAFAAGKVDAWWAIVNGYPQAVNAGARTLLTSNQLTTNDLGIWAASADVANANPAAIRAFLGVLEDLTKQSKQDPEKFQNVFLDKGPTATSGDQLARDITSTREANVPRAVEQKDVASIKSVADFFYANKLISKPVDAQKSVLILDGSGQ